jgi:V8-like Glu-specific endopeptidase
MKLKNILTKTSLALALIAITGGSITEPVYAKSNLNSTSYVYVSKDLKTGIESTITVPANTSSEIVSQTTDASVKISSKITLNSIIGNDDRTLVTNTTQKPYSSICRLQIKFPGSSIPQLGTGFMITSDMVATAAHCLYDESLGGYATSITVYPGENGTTNPYGSATSQTLNIPESYKSTESTKYDYGIIKLNSRIKDCGQLNYAIGASRFLKGSYKLYTAGYPLEGSHRMYTEQGNIISTTTDLVYYDLDTTGGQSGSPIMIYNGDHYVVVGIHHGEYPSENYGVRLNEGFDNLFLSIPD